MSPQYSILLTFFLIGAVLCDTEVIREEVEISDSQDNSQNVVLRTFNEDLFIEQSDLGCRYKAHDLDVVNLYRISPSALSDLTTPLTFKVDSTVYLLTITVNGSVPLETIISDPAGQPLYGPGLFPTQQPLPTQQPFSTQQPLSTQQPHPTQQSSTTTSTPGQRNFRLKRHVTFQRPEVESWSKILMSRYRLADKLGRFKTRDKIFSTYFGASTEKESHMKQQNLHKPAYIALNTQRSKLGLYKGKPVWFWKEKLRFHNEDVRKSKVTPSLQKNRLEKPRFFQKLTSVFAYWNDRTMNALAHGHMIVPNLKSKNLRSQSGSGAKRKRWHNKALLSSNAIPSRNDQTNSHKRKRHLPKDTVKISKKSWLRFTKLDVAINSSDSKEHVIEVMMRQRKTSVNRIVNGRRLRSRQRRHSSRRSSSIVTSEIAGSEVVWQMEPAVSGEWTITFFNELPWDIVVRATSPIDFRFNFLDMRTRSPIQGRPVAGDMTLMRLYVSGLACISKVTALKFFDVRGQLLQKDRIDDSQLDLGQRSKTGRNDTLVFFKMPLVPFRLAIEGDDVTHEPFQRLSSDLVLPRQFVISLIDYRADPLAPGTDYKFGIRIRNKGPPNQFYTTVDFSLLSYITGHASPDHVFVRTNEIVHVAIVVQIQPQITFISKSQMTITVRRWGDNVTETMTEEVTAMPQRFLVDYEAPSCTTVSVTGGCFMEAPCQTQTWGQTVSVMDALSGVRQAVVSDSPRSAYVKVTFSYSMSDRTALIVYRGNCCTLEVNLDVMDYANNPNTCKLVASFTTGAPATDISTTPSYQFTFSNWTGTPVPSRRQEITQPSLTWTSSDVTDRKTNQSPELTHTATEVHRTNAPSLSRHTHSTRPPTSKVNLTNSLGSHTDISDNLNLTTAQIATIVLGCAGGLITLTMTSFCLVYAWRRHRRLSRRASGNSSDYTMGSSWESQSTNGSWGRASLTSDLMAADATAYGQMDNVSRVNLVQGSEGSSDKGSVTTGHSTCSTSISDSRSLALNDSVVADESTSSVVQSGAEYSVNATDELYKDIALIQRQIEATIRRGQLLLAEGETYLPMTELADYSKSKNSNVIISHRGRSRSVGSRSSKFKGSKDSITKNGGTETSSFPRAKRKDRKLSRSASPSPELRKYVLEQNFRRSRENSPRGSVDLDNRMEIETEIGADSSLRCECADGVCDLHDVDIVNRGVDDSDESPERGQAEDQGLEAIFVKHDGQWMMRREVSPGVVVEEVVQAHTLIHQLENLKVTSAFPYQREGAGGSDPLEVEKAMQEYEEQQVLQRNILAMKQKLLDFQRRVDQEIEVEKQKSRSNSPGADQGEGCTG